VVRSTRPRRPLCGRGYFQEIHILYIVFAEHGMMINRTVCPPASKLDTCKRRGDTKHPEVVTVKSKQHDMQGTSYFVSCFFFAIF
jgi:hypothetical protein